MMDELFEQFMVEGRELIAKATDDLTLLEKNGSAAGCLDSAFRAVHTLKGSVAIFDLAPMGVALHAAEDLLGSLRSAEASIAVNAARSLLACLDQCERWMDEVEAEGRLPPDAPRAGLAIATGLLALTRGGAVLPTAREEEQSWVTELLERQSVQLTEDGTRKNARTAARYVPAADCFFAGDDPMSLLVSVPDLIALDIRGREAWAPLDEFDPYCCNLQIELLSGASEAELQKLFRFIPDQVEIVTLKQAATDEASPVGDSAGAAEAQRTIRVDAFKIDHLLDLIGELVVSKNGLAHLASQAENGMSPAAVAAAIRAAQATTDRLVSDLHETVMSVRMVPLEGVFRRIARMVRELSQRLERPVIFDLRGEETQVDKAVADALFEPLLHLVRNAIDHGLEDPEQRRAVGKNAEGKLSLFARAFGDQIMIELGDDGAGIDPARIRNVASKRQVATVERLQAMDDNAVLGLVFAPGFSTASTVSDVSGRGVGMDAVKSTIEQLGGRVSIASKLGEGTQVSLRLPATAALTTVLVIRVGAERVAVPLDVVVETLKLPTASIMPVGLGRAFVLRDRTLPLLNLAELLSLCRAPQCADAKVLVVDSGEGLVGLEVDDFSERLQVLLRPMAGILANVPGVSGTTLLGDGSVLLIVNLSEVIG